MKKRTLATSPAPSEPPRKRAKLEVRPDSDTPTYYINFAEVGHTIHDFSLMVARIPAKLSAEQTKELQLTGAVRIEPILQLVMPPSMIQPLLNALEIQMAKYKSAVRTISASKVKK